jgi:transposase
MAKKTLDNDKITALTHAGQTVEQIAEAMGVSRETMIDWFSHNYYPGIPPTKHSEFTTQERVKLAQSLYHAGATKTQIAAELGMSLGGFSEWCKRHGLNITRQRKRPTQKTPKGPKRNDES